MKKAKLILIIMALLLIPLSSLAINVAYEGELTRQNDILLGNVEIPTAEGWSLPFVILNYTGEDISIVLTTHDSQKYKCEIYNTKESDGKYIGWILMPVSLEDTLSIDVNNTEFNFQ